MYGIRVTLTAPTMHAMGLDTLNVYLVAEEYEAGVTTERAEATRFNGYLEALDQVEEFSHDVGIEGMEVVEL